VNTNEYLAGVRAALGDLPPGQRDELLEDLRAHLTEVAAEESGEPLEERLGSPAAYAADLRAAIAVEPRRRGSGLLTLARARLRAADANVGPFFGYERLSVLGAQLRPAWWLLRGYLAAMLIAYVINGGRVSLGLLPRIGDSNLVAVALLVIFLAGSVWLGRREHRFAKPLRVGLGAGAVVLAIVGISGFVTADWRWRSGEFYPEPQHVSDPYASISDLYVYDRDGRLLEGVTIYDQRGEQIVVKGVPRFRFRLEECGGNAGRSPQPGVYPYCPSPYPRPVPGATPTQTNGPAATPTATPTATQGLTPAPSPTG
jgi:hypothetical protein